MYGQLNAVSLGGEAGYLGESIFQWFEHRGGFFMIFVDSCPENHLLAETDVLLTGEKMLPN